MLQHKYHAKWKKLLVTQKDILYDSISMKYPVYTNL